MRRAAGAPLHRIDVHDHVFPPGYVRALRRIGVARTGGVPLPRRSAERALAVMDRQGIATAVTSISAPGVWFRDAGLARELARECNEFSSALVRVHPERFGAFAILPLPDVDAALAELRHALDILRRLYFDTAFSATPFVLPSLLALTGPSHVLFGTDLGAAAEFIAAETVRGIADERALSVGARRAIERENALALFPRLLAADPPGAAISIMNG